MKKKLMIILPVVLLVLGGVWKFKFSAPAEAGAKPKVAGEVYVLPKQFLVNLAGGKFAQLTVGLVLEEGATAAPAKAEEGAAKPPEGFGSMPQEAVVRDVVTDELTGMRASELVSDSARGRVKRAIAKAIEEHTDVPVKSVLITDVTVQ